MTRVQKEPISCQGRNASCPHLGRGLGRRSMLLAFDTGLVVWAWQMEVMLLLLFSQEDPNCGKAVGACEGGQGRPCSWGTMERCISQNTSPRPFRTSTAATMIVMFYCKVSWKTFLSCSPSSSIAWNFWSSLCIHVSIWWMASSHHGQTSCSSIFSDNVIHNVYPALTVSEISKPSWSR